MRINICILTILTLLAFTLSAHAIDLKRLNKIQKLQQQNMLQQARNAAKAWNFTKAKEWLNKAEKQSYNPKAIKEVEQLISNERQAKATEEKLGGGQKHNSGRKQRRALKQGNYLRKQE